MAEEDLVLLVISSIESNEDSDGGHSLSRTEDEGIQMHPRIFYYYVAGLWIVIAGKESAPLLCILAW